MGGEPKQFRRLGRIPMWRWSAGIAETLFERGRILELVVVFPRDYELVATDGALAAPVKFVAGGATRTESVRNGVAAASGEFVMIHDAARPFLPPEICEALMETATAEAGAAPFLESTDSLKIVDGDIKALPREKIFRTQTPQAFERLAILELLYSGNVSTDEASLWLASNRKLEYVRGSQKNFKITTDFDWAMAKSLVEGSKTIRTGLGFDVHELVPGRRLVLGGVEFASPLGLRGHSDADIICHAVSDALLGASGERDIGTLFPASDERYKDADSAELLGIVLRILASKGWSVGNIDVVLVAQVPRIGDGVQKIADNLKTLFTTIYPYAELGVKVKSGENVGSAGRAECMECYASALIERYDV
jgi:2-C-methyl-D-erythritol 4-phosphate cytidylyltransferase/2-C-methyl-D-erythritol 2,4-cyclodiphosphate synthase